MQWIEVLGMPTSHLVVGKRVFLKSTRISMSHLPHRDCPSRVVSAAAHGAEILRMYDERRRSGRGSGGADLIPHLGQCKTHI